MGEWVKTSLDTTENLSKLVGEYSFSRKVFLHELERVLTNTTSEPLPTEFARDNYIDRLIERICGINQNIEITKERYNDLVREEYETKLARENRGDGNEN